MQQKRIPDADTLDERNKAGGFMVLHLAFAQVRLAFDTA